MGSVTSSYNLTEEDRIGYSVLVKKSSTIYCICIRHHFWLQIYNIAFLFDKSPIYCHIDNCRLGLEPLLTIIFPSVDLLK